MKRIVRAFKNSWAGLSSVFCDEVAFRQDLLVVICGLTVLVFLNISVVLKAMLAFSLFLIPIAELVNTAVERVVDRIGAEYHILSKQAKDIGSAIVLCVFCAVIILWVGVLIAVL